MSVELKPFAFEDQLVRVIMQNDEPWFVAKDVCAVLGINNHRMACEKLDEDEKGVSLTDTLGGDQETLIVSESGLYTIILRSRAATTPGSVAHRFRKWVTAEVLPSIRRTGGYDMPGRAPEADEDERTIPGLGPLSEVAVRARLVEIAERISGKPAARALWQRLGLPWVEAMEEIEAKASGGMEAEPDPVALFAVEGVERERNIMTPAHVLWTAFIKFCVIHNLPAPSQKAFFMRFAAMGFTKRRMGGRMIYQGLRPKIPQEAEAGG